MTRGTGEGATVSPGGTLDPYANVDADNVPLDRTPTFSGYCTIHARASSQALARRATPLARALRSPLELDNSPQAHRRTRNAYYLI